MGRQMLRLVMVLGALVTLVGGTGIYAVFSDTASGGQNSVVSGARPSAADLQIASATVSNGNFACAQPYTDNTTTGQFSVTGLQPTSSSTLGYVCVRNNGAASLNLTTGATNLVDADTSCTGDEAAAGDASCGNNGAGELSPLLSLRIEELNCAGSQPISSNAATVSALASQAVDLGAAALAPASVMCVRFTLNYAASTPEATIQIAQSDTATWNFAFTGTAP
jgi:hypothetical protein